MIDRWRLDYNHHRIHSSLDYPTPAAYAAVCVLPTSATPQPPEHSALPTPILSLNLVQRLGGSHVIQTRFERVLRVFREFSP